MIEGAQAQGVAFLSTLGLPQVNPVIEQIRAAHAAMGTPFAQLYTRRLDALLARPMNISNVSSPRCMTVQPTDNRMLGALPAEELHRWRPYLELVDMPVDTSLWSGGESPGYVYFPATASVSLMRTTREGDSLEVLAIGSEGIVGLQAIMGGGAALEGAVVRVGGQGYRVSSGWLYGELQKCEAAMGLVLRYAHALMTHAAQAAICTTHHSLEQRMCRCLLKTFDHGHGRPISLTHESLSHMLGVRREGVTSAALKLQRIGVIRYARGRVALLDRPALETRSCECYRVVKTVYDRLPTGSTPITNRVSRHIEAPLASHAPWPPSPPRPRHHSVHRVAGAMAR